MSRVLLDTHAVLWWFTDDDRLSPRARAVISDPDNKVYVSAASAWEISTKERLGKLDTVPGASEQFGRLVARNSFTHLAIDHRHALAAGAFEVEHRDPFDRMLAAQSWLESLALVTRDQAFGKFEVDTIW